MPRLSAFGRPREMAASPARRPLGTVVAPELRQRGGSCWLTVGGLIATVFIFNATRSSGSSIDHTIAIRADEDSGCHAEITVGNHTLPVLLDTGATGDRSFVFGSNHVADLGLSPRSLTYSSPYVSTNGEGRETIVQLHDVRMQGWHLGNLTAAITSAPQPDGLLSAELLHRLKFRTENGFCILTMPENGS
jgi:predicted aspartyl protease